MNRLIGILLLTLTVACSSAPASTPTDSENSCEPTPARLLEGVQAEYPPAARRAGIEGVVKALAQVDATGAVTGLRVVVGPGYGLDENAAEVFWQWVFEPATENCAPVESAVWIIHEFQLTDAHKSASEATITYTCPMHPEVRQNGFGTCPTCHMDLIPAQGVE